MQKILSHENAIGGGQNRYKQHFHKQSCLCDYPQNQIESENLPYLKSQKYPAFIVSFTSFPQRIRFVKYGILSILTQSIKPQKIVLYLSILEFPKQAKNLPLTLRFLWYLGLVDIIFVQDNFLAYKKLIFALKDFPKSIIITIDDDQFYAPNTLEILLDSYIKFPNAIHAHSIYDDLFLECSFNISANKPQLYYRALGVGGVLYPPNAFNDEVFNASLFMKLAPYGDDLWFHSMAVLNHTKTVLVKNHLNHPKIQTIKWSESPNLFDINIKENLAQSQAIYKAYPQIKKHLLELLI